MLWHCTHWPEGVGSFRHPGCYDIVRTDQSGWDLLDIMHVIFSGFLMEAQVRIFLDLEAQVSRWRRKWVGGASGKILEAQVSSPPWGSGRVHVEKLPESYPVTAGGSAQLREGRVFALRTSGAHRWFRLARRHGWTKMTVAAFQGSETLACCILEPRFCRRISRQLSNDSVAFHEVGWCRMM